MHFGESQNVLRLLSAETLDNAYRVEGVMFGGRSKYISRSSLFL